MYDPGSASVLLYGGGNSPPLSGDTWRWDGSNWSALFTTNSPPDRTAHTMAARSSGPTYVLVYGGKNGTTQYNDTWTFDGNDWTQHPNAVGPPGLEFAAMVYHAGIGRFVHFGSHCPGGCFSDTYEWDGSNWSAVFTANSPPPRIYHSMAYDPLRQEVVLFGGQSRPPVVAPLNDTWVYDGINWTQKQVTGPPPLTSHTMAFDPSRGTVVLHGGFDNGTPSVSNQTWEWDGNQWTLVGEINTHSDAYHALVYDGSNEQLLLLNTSTTPRLLFMDWSTAPVVAPVGGSATADYPCPLQLGITLSSGSGTYQWYKNGIPLANGGSVSGATSPTLNISPTSASDAGSYFCRVTGACGMDDSGTIVVNARCIADVNGNGVADPGDYTAWINAFNNNDSAADQNCDGAVTPTDFTAWIANYNAGC